MILAVDLTPPARRAARSIRRRLAYWACASVLYGACVACGAAAIRLGQAKGDRAEQAVVERARLRSQELAESSARAARDVSVRVRTLEAAERAGKHPDWSLLLRAITTARGDDVVLESFELRPIEASPAVATPRAANAGAAPAAIPSVSEQSREAFSLNLRGVGVSHSAVLRFVARLEQLGPIDRVEVVQTRRHEATLSASGAQPTWFDLQCTLQAQRSDSQTASASSAGAAAETASAVTSAEESP